LDRTGFIDSLGWDATHIYIGKHKQQWPFLATNLATM
jgi:hypothetical protein